MQQVKVRQRRIKRHTQPHTVRLLRFLQAAAPLRLLIRRDQQQQLLIQPVVRQRVTQRRFQHLVVRLRQGLQLPHLTRLSKITWQQVTWQ